MTEPTVALGTSGVTAEQVLAVARRDAHVELTAEARAAVARGRGFVEEMAASDVAVYGVSTGFGALASTKVSPQQRAELQRALVRSHAAGVGPEVEREVVRALMFLRCKTLASGRTGVRLETLETYLAVLNAGITPIVHEFGSLGCSGDLAPLAHCAMVLMGEGRARDKDGVERPVPELLAEAGIAPVELAEKEGLALINGTDGMLGQLILACEDMRELIFLADVTAALSSEALLGTDRVFEPQLHGPLRPHPGQAESAATMVAVMQGSEIVASHRVNCDIVQDAYSLRCAPQVHGAGRDTVDYCLSVAERELAAVVDNPILTDEGALASNGNFHGAPVAYALDFLAIPAADLASVCERRTDRLLDPARSHGLPAFLSPDPGVNSGLMIAQYTQAGLVHECKRLAVPSSVDSIPTSAMQEDHVSLGWSAARKVRRSIEALRHVIAIELYAATRGLDLRAPLKPSPVAQAIIAELRESVQGPGGDRFTAPELAATEAFLASGRVRAIVEEHIGCR